MTKQILTTSRGSFLFAQLITMLLIGGVYSSSRAAVVDQESPTSGVMTRAERDNYDLNFGGTGCPVGTVHVVDAQSEFQNEIKVVFDSFAVNPRGSARLDRKACAIAIPLAVPRGYRVGFEMKAQMDVLLSKKDASVIYNQEIFTAGRRGPQSSKTWSGPLVEQDYELPDKANIIWSGCGDSVNLRANFSLLANRSQPSTDAFAEVTSAKLQLHWKACSQ